MLCLSVASAIFSLASLIHMSISYFYKSSILFLAPGSKTSVTIFILIIDSAFALSYVVESCPTLD